jgi:hypothetical protein
MGKPNNYETTIPRREKNGCLFTTSFLKNLRMLACETGDVEVLDAL